MKTGAPWSIKGIEPEAREAAKEKARAAGLTLGQWLNQTIAESGQPAPVSESAAPAPSSGGALDTARLMRAIAEVARRVDVIGQQPARAAAIPTERLDEISARLDLLSQALPAEEPTFDQSRLERGLVAIVRRIESLESASATKEAIDELKAELSGKKAPVDQVTPALGNLNQAVESLMTRVDRLAEAQASSAETASGSADALATRLNEMEVAVRSANPGTGDEATADRLSGDIRKLMNGLVNIAAKIEGIDNRIEAHLAPVKSSVADLRSKLDRTGPDSVQSDRDETAITSAMAPVLAAIAALQSDVDAIGKSRTASVEPETDFRSEIRPEGAAAVTPTQASTGEEPLTEVVYESPESEPAPEEILPASADGTPDYRIDETRPDDDPPLSGVASSESSDRLQDGYAEETQPEDDLPLSGVASLHDLTRADDIRIRPFDDEEDFFTEIQDEEDAPPPARPVDDVSQPDADQQEPAMAQPTEPEPEPDQELDDTVHDAPEPQRATVAPMAADHIPDDANPPDRPRRLVPVESLLVPDREHVPPPDSSVAAPEPTLSGNRPERTETPQDEAVASEAAGPAAGERKPFRLDEPLDLSRQSPAPPPASYPGRRRGLGYLLVGLFFLVLFVGGFWFAGTPQFSTVATEADDIWEQAKAAVMGVELPVESESPSDASPPSPSTTDGAAEAETKVEDNGTISGQSSENVDEAPASETSQPDNSAAATPAPKVAALQPQPEQTAPPAAAPSAAAPAAAAPAPAVQPDSLRSKADAGDADSQFQLGVRYRDGIGVEANYSTAADWFEAAAQQGHTPAQLGLGIMYRQGLGRPRDLDLAKLWLHAAARSGDPDAQKLLGEVYVDQTEGAPDYFQAARWFRQAAEQGVVDAQYNMGVLYEGGLGVPRDFSQAYFWFSLAARAGDRSAPEDAARIAELLTPEQRSEIDSQVTSFNPTRQSGRTLDVPSFASGASDTLLEGRDEVRLLQQLLISRGYDPGTPDGIPGSRTRGAIKRWQTDHGLPIDGRISEAVLDSLQTAD